MSRRHAVQGKKKHYTRYIFWEGVEKVEKLYTTKIPGKYNENTCGYFKASKASGYFDGCRLCIDPVRTCKYNEQHLALATIMCALSATKVTIVQ